MNKKVLLLTLAFVVAFAGSALAAVELTGEFVGTAEQKSFKVFQDNVDFTTAVDFNLKGALEPDEDGLGIDLSASVDLKVATSTFTLGKYKVGLYDQYFKAWIWGNDAELTDLATPFDFIKAAKKAPTKRARLEVPVLDLVTFNLDFAPSDNLRAFAESVIEGYKVGLAYARTDWSDKAKVKDTIVAYGSGAFGAVNVKAAAGAIVGKNLGLAFGVGADTKPLDELKVEGHVTFRNDKWLAENTTELFAKATYTEVEYQAIASLKQILKTTNENEIEVKGYYRFSDALAYGDLFHKDKWFNNTAPAVGVGAKLKDFKFDNVRVDASSPVVDDMVWVKAYGSYDGAKEIKAGVLGHILATNKLTVKPQVDYISTDKVIDAQLAADYLIGNTKTKITVLVQKVFSSDAAKEKELIKAQVKVPF